MKAVFINQPGKESQLQYRDVPDAHDPRAGEIKIRVAAAGLNRADLLQAKGLYPPPAGYRAEMPGLEFAGHVAAVGDGVTEFSIGDRVMGIAAGEAQAEYITLSAQLVVPIPDPLDMVDAAGVPEAFITAHDAVVSQAAIKGRETLLIHAAGSGVGLAGVQICKALGCKVIGTSRTSYKLVRAKEYGLDHAITVTDPPEFAEQVIKLSGGSDVVLDLVGGSYFAENLKCVKRNGRIIVVGLTAGTRSEIDLGSVLRNRIRIQGTVLRSRTDNEKGDAVAGFAKDLLPMFENGRLRPVIDRTFDANDAGDAYRYLASNESFGKVILKF
jgi:NADPH:quinone reductase